MSASPAVLAPAVPVSPVGARARAVALRIVGPLVVLAAVIGIWSLLSVTVYGDKNYLVPRPWQVASAIGHNSALLLAATKTTFIESVLGFAAAIVVGIGFAILMSQSKLIERSLYPWAVLLQTVPVVAVAPIIVLWFKYGTLSLVIISFMIAVFPILTNTLLGLLSTDRNHTDLFRLHHANRFVRFVKLQLPTALPNVITGLKISAGLSVIGAIVGEFIIGSGGSQGGLGVKVIYTQAQLDTPLLFAEVIFATLLGFCFFMAVTVLGNRLLSSWHESALQADA